VWKQKQEKRSKSTAVHAKVLAPEDVHFIDYDPADLSNIPEYDLAATILIFPSDDAVSVVDIDFTAVTKVVAIDSTW
jgi:hypothetical protein